MGLWNKVFGGAEGIREAMRESYEKHARLVREGKMPGADSPHQGGLYGALWSRYLARGMPVVEPILLGELAPFLAMTESEAPVVLAEYVVYQERPSEARMSWLTHHINAGLSGARVEIALAILGIVNQVAWCALLTPATRSAIEEAANRLRQEGM